jgi:hypothetical protein
MTACADESTTVHYCLICGPCLRIHTEDAEITCHLDLPHPDCMNIDEEENPQ